MTTFRLKITLTPPHGEKIERIFASQSVVVGRSKSCDFTLDSEGLSRKHCRIEFESGQFFITDLGSTNGVYVEGNRIPPEVRTPFKNILPLQISQFDCQVSEDETLVFEYIPTGNTKSITITRPTKNINVLPNPVAVPGPGLAPGIESKAKTQDNKFKILVSLIILGFMALVFYQQQNKKPRSELIEELNAPPVTTTGPKKSRIAPQKNKDFFINAEYVENHSKRNCEEKVYCENLYLDILDHEGLYEIGDDFIVYFKPAKHLQERKYKALTKDEVDLVAFDYILTSNLMTAYFSRKVNQIHLVIIESDNLPKRVYLFSPGRYNSPSANKSTIYQVLQNAIARRSPQDFWYAISPLVPKKDIHQ